MERSEQDIKMTLQQISAILLINGGFSNNPGLYSGEMGLVLFFTRYARHTQNDLYVDYAYDLMGKVQHKIHQGTPINYKQGLTGIGSSIEYLVQNDYFEADTDELLEDFDKRIFFTYNLSNLPVDELKDIGYYALWRMSGNSSKKDMIRQIIVPQIERHSVFPKLCRQNLPESFKEKTYGYCLELIEKKEFWSKDLGLQNGLAGWGLSLLTELDGDDSWILLLQNDLQQ